MSTGDIFALALCAGIIVGIVLGHLDRDKPDPPHLPGPREFP